MNYTMSHYAAKLHFYFIAGFFCLFGISTSSAWDATGHIIVAQIASNSLQPSVRDKIEQAFDQSEFAKSFPTYTPYVYSASWPDYLLYSYQAPPSEVSALFKFFQEETGPWHYISSGYIYAPQTDGMLPPTPPVNNLVWAINMLQEKLKTMSKNGNYDELTYTIVFLTHLVGDIHEPMHNITLYDDNFPYGDKGGNLYKIQPTFNVSDLHALWDISLGRFSEWPGFNRDPGYRPPIDLLTATANNFQSLCQVQEPIGTPNEWHNASFQLAVNAYPINNANAPSLNGNVSATYIFQGRDVAAKQMCLAGKRLATILNNTLQEEAGTPPKS